MKAVSNASPLIYLAKIKQIRLLPKLFQEILVSNRVYEETMIRGRELGYEDANLINEQVQTGFINVRRVSLEKQFLKEFPIEEGEKETIQLALREKISTVLADERKARIAAEMLGLKPLGTIGVLSLAVKQGAISRKQMREDVLKLVKKGYRIREEILSTILEELEKP
jgi:predicted nucleic acid-binding protein